MINIQRQRSRGITLLELLVGLAIIGILSTVGLNSYRGYLERIDYTTAERDIRLIAAQITAFALDSDGKFPANLAILKLDNYLDPWGNAYEYLNITTAKGNGKKRKDRNLVPINSDFDLYSKGPDGESVSPLTARKSHDDIIRANNGAFIGKASEY